MIRKVALCNRLSGERGAGGLGWLVVGERGGVLRGGGGAGGGDVQNDAIDDKFMQLCDGSCNLFASICLQKLWRPHVGS